MLILGSPANCNMFCEIIAKACKFGIILELKRVNLELACQFGLSPACKIEACEIIPESHAWNVSAQRHTDLGTEAR